MEVCVLQEMSLIIVLRNLFDGVFFEKCFLLVPWELSFYVFDEYFFQPQTQPQFQHQWHCPQLNFSS